MSTITAVRWLMIVAIIGCGIVAIPTQSAVYQVDPAAATAGSMVVPIVAAVAVWLTMRPNRRFLQAIAILATIFIVGGTIGMLTA